jgi:hypothetical protein
MINLKYGYELVRVDTEVGKATGVRHTGTGVETQVLPLNGWRARNLAYALFGERTAGLWELGVSKLVRVQELVDLPEWDGPNTAFLRKFSGVVCIEVVCVNTGYGSYIEVTQMGTAADVAYWRQQDDMMSGRLAALGLCALPGVLVARGAEEVMAYNL